jgi:predicted CXXCH cytochrome family protein
MLICCAVLAMHSHAQELQPGALDPTGSTAPAPKTLIPRDGCVTAECHPGVKAKQHLHGPVHVNACDSCHTLTSETDHTFVPVRSRDEMCGLCHVVETPPDSMLHEPFARGECLSCHDPHGSTERAMLRGERYADSCNACHEDVTGAHSVVHGPASAGACGACHQPHASPYPKLLMAQGRDLCLRCHVTTGHQIDSLPSVHEPVLGDCLICHDPHATDNAAILSADPLTLCTGCHQEIANKVEHAPTQHDAVTSERSCLNCHAAHAAGEARLLKQDTQSLCFECHNKVIKLEDGTELQDMKQLIENHDSLHGAIAQDSCVVCHEIHGGGHRRLLTHEYPTDLYYPFSENAYALCFGCHDRQLALLGRTEAVTSFRNGDTNLHYVHVNRDEKGRSCSVCHDAHAADADRHIRAEVPFGPGKWMLPIKYESLAEGGRCGPGCHQSFEYNRVNPVEYPPIQDAEAWKGLDLVPGVPAETPRPRRRKP